MQSDRRNPECNLLLSIRRPLYWLHALLPSPPLRNSMVAWPVDLPFEVKDRRTLLTGPMVDSKSSYENIKQQQKHEHRRDPGDPTWEETHLDLRLRDIFRQVGDHNLA